MRLVRALGAVTLAALLAGCGGGSGAEAKADGSDIGVVDPSLDPETGVLPDDSPLSASEVAAGLRVVKDLASTAATALGPNELELAREDAPALQAEIAPSWATVAPTVSGHDAATATALEEAFPALASAITAGDQAAARAAADKIGAAVDAYVVKFPPEAGSTEGTGEDPGDGSLGPGVPTEPPPAPGMMPAFTAAPTIGPEPEPTSYGEPETATTSVPE